VRHVSSDYLQMSCYGYDFKNWKDETGKDISANSDYTFTVMTKDLSAIWERHIFDVKFWKTKLAGQE